MKLMYRDRVYLCASVEKKPNEMLIHTGKYDEDGEEIFYQILGDIRFDEVMLEGGTWTEAPASAPEQRIAEMEEALELLLSGVTE